MIDRKVFDPQKDKLNRDRKALRYNYVFEMQMGNIVRRDYIPNVKWDCEDRCAYMKFDLVEKGTKRNGYIPTLKAVLFKRVVMPMPTSTGWAVDDPHQHALRQAGIIVSRLNKKGAGKSRMSDEVHFRWYGECEVALFELLMPTTLFETQPKENKQLFLACADGKVRALPHK